MKNERKLLVITVLLVVCTVAGCGRSGDSPASPAGSCTSAAFPELYAAASANANNAHWDQIRCALARIGSVDEGLQRQAEYVEFRARRSKRAGYKVALGSEQAYSSFGLSRPVVGVLFEDMLLASGSRVSRSSGFRLGYEADLMAKVGDAAINEARTLEEVARSLESLIAFIELPDLIVMPAPDAGGQFLAINASAHLGIVGASLAVSPDPVFIASLESMQVVMTGADGAVLSAARGSAVMGNPLNALLVLAEQLRARGEALRPGDMVSLGTYSPPTPVGETSAVTVTYEGVGGASIAVSVAFE